MALLAALVEENFILSISITLLISEKEIRTNLPRSIICLHCNMFQLFPWDLVTFQGGCFGGNERGISPFDPLVDVFLPLDDGVTPIVSAKDTAAACLDVASMPTQLNERRTRVLIIGASGQGVCTTDNTWALKLKKSIMRGCADLRNRFKEEYKVEILNFEGMGGFLNYRILEQSVECPRSVMPSLTVKKALD